MDLGSEFSDTGNFSGFKNNDLYGGDKSSNTFERNFHNIFEEAKKYRQRIYDAERKMNGGADDNNSSKPKRQINKPLRLMLDISKILRDSGNYKDLKTGDYMGIAKLISDRAKEKVGTTEISDEVRSEALKMARDPDEFVTKYRSKKQSSSSSSSNSRGNSRGNSRNRSRRNNDWDDSDDSDDSDNWDQRGGNNDGDNIKTDVWNDPQQTSNFTGGCGCGMKGGNNWDNMRVFNDTKNLSNNNSTNTLNNNNTIISNLNNATNTLNNNNTTTSNLNNSTIISGLNNATNTSNLNNAVSTLDNNNTNISNFNNATNTRNNNNATNNLNRNTYAFNNGNKLNNTAWSNFRKSTIY
ncbi:hypothetical protein [Acanthamoeba polyphaga mimivirus]|nr:hypothetical protein [Acanthamoeba castellanii mamavirus]EJN40839.1 hypothetical protein lvs_L335 [Acanthamoeba polyphaga lentillevirus]UMZ08082.1 hypothetical protein [Acanthamoeba polyphaga mimivirus]